MDGATQGGGIGGDPLDGGANVVQDTSYTQENKGLSASTPAPVSARVSQHAHAAYGVSRGTIWAAVYEVMSRRCECITCGNLKGKRVGEGYLVECGPLDWWRVYPVEEMTPQVLEGIGRRRVKGCRLYDGGDGGE